MSITRALGDITSEAERQRDAVLPASVTTHVVAAVQAGGRDNFVIAASLLLLEAERLDSVALARKAGA